MMGLKRFVFNKKRKKDSQLFTILDLFLLLQVYIKYDKNNSYSPYTIND